MLQGKKIIVVLPAYNAEKTLELTYSEIPKDIVDEVIMVDDCSVDGTVEIAHRLGIEVIIHEKNRGYGGNQKTCYETALKRGADIVVMLHPDYQYSPKLITAMAGLIASGMFDVVLGSRILGGYATKGGMPLYKYISNRLLTLFQNLFTGQKLSEYHTGYRVFSNEVLSSLPILENSDDFVFDNQMLMQAIYFGYRIGEITATCSYNRGCSSISFKRSVVYGLGILKTVLAYLLQSYGFKKYPMFDKDKGRAIEIGRG
ncbi:MAG: glycosyltransferase family 2 protein [Candidatus Omnitrophota bacterium]|jgi:glycosyltransferase involved in cell wall biosynthesis